MITAKELPSGRHINLKVTYRIKCVRTHFMRENRPLGLTWRGLETGLRFDFQGTNLQPSVNQLFTRQVFARWGQVRSPVV
jgi:hypothetical protein